MKHNLTVKNYCFALFVSMLLTPFAGCKVTPPTPDKPDTTPPVIQSWVIEDLDTHEKSSLNTGSIKVLYEGSKYRMTCTAIDKEGLNQIAMISSPEKGKSTYYDGSVTVYGAPPDFLFPPISDFYGADKDNKVNTILTAAREFKIPDTKYALIEMPVFVSATNFSKGNANKQFLIYIKPQSEKK